MRESTLEKSHINVSIVTKNGELRADAFVLATGAWAPSFENELGCKLAIQPGKGYAITMERPRTFPGIPCFFEEHSIQHPGLIGAAWEAPWNFLVLIPV